MSSKLPAARRISECCREGQIVRWVQCSKGKASRGQPEHESKFRIIFLDGF